MKNIRRSLALIFILSGLIIIYFIKSIRTTPVFSPYSVLISSWDVYKKDFIDKEGRVIDNQQDISTSEGQSYAMLRSVYVDDKETFDKVWKWTQKNLRKNESALFGWKWGKRDDGSFGFLPGGGENTASDANIDIALSLIFAHKRWNQAEYLKDAEVIIDDIWDYETDTAMDKRYLLAGNWAKFDDNIILNPSYFAPYAWRIFSQVDKNHDWLSMINPAYEILLSSGYAGLDKEKGVGLPPNWLAVNRNNGTAQAPGIEGLNTEYSFDAMRVPFRIALDYLWFGEEKALNYLKAAYIKLDEEYSHSGKIALAYSHDGIELNPAENPAMYATSLGYFLISDKEKAKNIYEEKIVKLYSNENQTFKSELGYYEQNWLWFGSALYNNFLENLYK